MKKIITILLLTASVISLAQETPALIGYHKNFIDSLQYDKVVFPKTIQLSPDLIKKILAINKVPAVSTIRKNYLNSQQWNKNNVIIKYQKGLGTINMLQPDNMPCLVPNLQTVAAMPIVKPLVTATIPNPLYNKSNRKNSATF
jgi:hypothetical protein